VKAFVIFEGSIVPLSLITCTYVVGNVRHAGLMMPVDEILGRMAPQVGLEFDKAWVLRRRGNSAQQMGQYGQEPARESIVLLAKNSS
jgi:hypothetical protein